MVIFKNFTHWNCNSIKNKITFFTHYLNTHNPCIISLNETKLNSETAAKYLVFENYTVIHKARNNQNGAGGVALLIQKSITYSSINEFDDLNLELIAIRLNFEQTSLVVVTYYNPPDKTLCTELFHRLSQKFKFFLLLGDLNAKSTLLDSNNSNNNGDILNEIILNTNTLILNNSDFTHRSFSGLTESVLDIILCSSELYEFLMDFKVLYQWEMHSDHFPVSISLNKTNARLESNIISTSACKKSATNFNFKKADWEIFRKNLPSTFPVEIENDVDKLNAFIVDSLLIAAKKAIPQVKVKQNRKTLSECIVYMIKLRKKL